jgi:hypothetical protein
VDHLENEGEAGAHLDLADIEAEPKKGFEERTLAVGLATHRERDGTDNVVFEVGGGAVLLGIVSDSQKKIHPTAHFLLFSLLRTSRDFRERAREGICRVLSFMACTIRDRTKRGYRIRGEEEKRGEIQKNSPTAPLMDPAF